MNLGINYIDKQEFLPLYQQACTEALHEKNIQNSFAATGLVPYKPDCVLSLLHTEFHTPSPQLSPQIQIAWTAETPHNITGLQHQTELIKQYLKRRTQSPLSPTERALNQLVKGCEIAMNSAVLLSSQNKKLFTENQHQKRKKAQRRSYIAKGGVLSGTQAQSLIENRENSCTEVIEGVESRIWQHAPSKCNLCSSLKHTACTCSECQSTVLE